MPLSDYDKTHLHDIMAGEGDWTSAELLRFIALMASKSRPTFEKLARAFPEEARAYEWWYDHRADEPFPY